jgi:hypothetical protein
MTLRYIPLLCFLLLFCTSPLNANVTVTFNENVFRYKKEPRLADVLSAIALERQWYWPAAKLYKENMPVVDSQRNTILIELSDIAQEWPVDSKEHDAIITLKTEISNWKLAQRIIIEIDYDFARIRAEKNPRFDDGSYILNLVERPKSLTIFGAISSERLLLHKSNTDVGTYLTQVSLLNSSDKDHVYVIKADGRVLKAGVAYWNKNHQEVMPGSQIFVPFRSDFFSSELSELNERIARLSVHRISF